MGQGSSMWGQPAGDEVLRALGLVVRCQGYLLPRRQLDRLVRVRQEARSDLRPLQAAQQPGLSGVPS